MAAVDVEGPPLACHGLCSLSLELQQMPPRVVSSRRARQGLRERVPRLPQVGLQRHRTLERRHGVLVTAIGHETATERDERERIVRVEPRGDRQLGERLVLTALLRVHAREVAMGRGVVEVRSRTSVNRGRGARHVQLQQREGGHRLVHLCPSR